MKLGGSVSVASPALPGSTDQQKSQKKGLLRRLKKAVSSSSRKESEYDNYYKNYASQKSKQEMTDSLSVFTPATGSSTLSGGTRLVDIQRIDEKKNPELSRSSILYGGAGAEAGGLVGLPPGFAGYHSSSSASGNGDEEKTNLLIASLRQSASKYNNNVDTTGSHSSSRDSGSGSGGAAFTLLGAKTHPLKTHKSNSGNSSAFNSILKSCSGSSAAGPLKSALRSNSSRLKKASSYSVTSGITGDSFTSSAAPITGGAEQARRTASFVEFDFDDSISIVKSLELMSGTTAARGPTPKTVTLASDYEIKSYDLASNAGDDSSTTRQSKPLKTNTNLPQGPLRMSGVQSKKSYALSSTADASSEDVPARFATLDCGESIVSKNNSVATNRTSVTAPGNLWEKPENFHLIKHWTDDRSIATENCLLAPPDDEDDDDYDCKDNDEATEAVAQDLHDTVLSLAAFCPHTQSQSSSNNSHCSSSNSSVVVDIEEEEWMRFLDLSSKGAVPDVVPESMRRKALKKQLGALHSLLNEQKSYSRNKAADIDEIVGLVEEELTTPSSAAAENDDDDDEFERSLRMFMEHTKKDTTSEEEEKR